MGAPTSVGRYRCLDLWNASLIREESGFNRDPASGNLAAPAQRAGVSAAGVTIDAFARLVVKGPRDCYSRLIRLPGPRHGRDTPVVDCRSHPLD